MRTTRHYVLLHPDDCDAPHSLDLTPNGRDDKKVSYLTEAFAKSGFDENHSALVGYPLGGRIQLLSGTHRLEAAKRAGIRLPVTIFLRSYVEAAWGTENWADLIRDVPVKELQRWDVSENTDFPGLDERIDLTQEGTYEKLV